MENSLGKAELLGKLELLKKLLQSFDYSILKNVVFYNVYSLYVYICEISYKGNNCVTVKKILDEIEMYIPLALTDSSLEIFLSAASAESEIEAERIRDIFSYRSRMDFINLVRCTRDNASWEKIIELCEDMRRKKEIQKAVEC